MLVEEEKVDMIVECKVVVQMKAEKMMVVFHCCMMVVGDLIVLHCR